MQKRLLLLYRISRSMHGHYPLASFSAKYEFKSSSWHSTHAHNTYIHTRNNNTHTCTHGHIHTTHMHMHPHIGTNPCALNNGGCTHLCLLSSVQEAGFTCNCPGGTMLNSTQGVCESTSQHSPSKKLLCKILYKVPRLWQPKSCPGSCLRSWVRWARSWAILPKNYLLGHNTTHNTTLNTHTHMHTHTTHTHNAHNTHNTPQHSTHT